VNDQEAYEAARAWIAREGSLPCFDPEKGQCVYYREEDGNRCAIGGILSLETAKELQDEVGNVYLIVRTTDDDKGIVIDGGGSNGELAGATLQLLGRLQQAHDVWAERCYYVDDETDEWVFRSERVEDFRAGTLASMDEAALAFHLEVVQS
jgi:hypothetical protein